MLLIAHRGNIRGPVPEYENSPEYIRFAIGCGFKCEIDLWLSAGDLFLGHDKPQYKIAEKFLSDFKNSLYIHAKNSDALAWLVSRRELEFFSHNRDEFVVTSFGSIWCYPSNKPIKFGINLMPEWNNLRKEDLIDCYGLCSDFIERYK